MATVCKTHGPGKRHAERSLAYFISKEEEAHGLRLTTYGANLALMSVDYEVEIIGGDETAWIRAQGLACSMRACECNARPSPGFHQRWYRPAQRLFESMLAETEQHHQLYAALHGTNWPRYRRRLGGLGFDLRVHRGIMSWLGRLTRANEGGCAG